MTAYNVILDNLHYYRSESLANMHGFLCKYLKPFVQYAYTCTEQK